MKKILVLSAVLFAALAGWMTLNAGKAPEPTTAVAAADPAPAPSIELAQADTGSASARAQAAPQAASGPTFVQGKDFRALPSAQPTSSSPDSVEVAEVFMYSCPHCYSLEPFVKSYKSSMPANVSFVRIPANFNAMARQHSRAFYAAEALGVTDEVHEAFFQEIHVRKNRLANEDALVKFFASQGVDGEEFRAAMNSFSVDTNLRRADDLARRYKITSVPALVVNGKYVTQASMAGSMPRLRQILDYLVARESGAL
ncbi:MAG: thiol:disulfide interchange protein DsbA/DsbL [Pseudomonadota bacterium]